MSPTVPPTSVITTSTSSVARRLMRALISSVMWGMTCTVLPEVVAAALGGDHRLVDRAGGGVGVAVEVLVDEALVVPEVEVGLAAVVGDEHLAVLEGVHRPRVDVDVRVELLHRDPQAPGLQQPAERRRGEPLAQGARHAAGHEDVLRHTNLPTAPPGRASANAGYPSALRPLRASPRGRLSRAACAVSPTERGDLVPKRRHLVAEGVGSRCRAGPGRRQVVVVACRSVRAAASSAAASPLNSSTQRASFCPGARSRRRASGSSRVASRRNTCSTSAERVEAGQAVGALARARRPSGGRAAS